MSILCIGTDTTIEVTTSFERFIGMPYMRLDHDFTENRFTVTLQYRVTVVKVKKLGKSPFLYLESELVLFRLYRDSSP